MVNSKNERSELRKYLLEKIASETDHQRIEARLLIDEQYQRFFSLVEEELIEDYVDDQLSQPERADFESSFLNSPERHEKLKFALDLNKLVEEQKRHKALPPPVNKLKPIFISNRLPGLKFSAKQRKAAVVASAAVIIIAAFLFSIIHFTGDSSEADEKRALASLNDAYRKYRPLESRISRLDYAPVNNLRGGPAEGAGNEKYSKDQAKLLSLNLVKKAASSENLHLLGRFYLTEKEFDIAIELLKRASRLTPSRAEILNDLGVAYFEKSKILSSGGREKDLELLGWAAESFDRAIELDPYLLEPLFNKAAYLQTVDLPSQARQLWEQYLLRDPNSPWAQEARRNLQHL